MATTFEAVSDSVSHPNAVAKTTKTMPIMANPIAPRIHPPSFPKGLASPVRRAGILGRQSLVSLARDGRAPRATSLTSRVASASPVGREGRRSEAADRPRRDEAAASQGLPPLPQRTDPGRLWRRTRGSIGRRAWRNGG
jgi:hypothetical protein